MNTRSTNRSRDGPWNSSFDRSSQRNNSFNSLQNSRSNYRGNSYYSNEDPTASTETTAEIEGTNNNRDTNREIKITRTGMRIIKIETGLTTGENRTNINIIETSIKHRD